MAQNNEQKSISAEASSIPQHYMLCPYPAGQLAAGFQRGRFNKQVQVNKLQHEFLKIDFSTFLLIILQTL